MSNRTKHRATPAVVRDRPDVASRVAWTYLGCLLALVVGGLVLVVVNALVVGYGCRLADADAVADCQLAWAIVAFGAGTLAGFGIVVKPLKLDVWVWVALVVLGLAMLVIGQITAVWWWLVLLCIPALAALASAPWGKGRARTVRQVVMLVLLVVALAGAAVWYVLG